MFPLFLYITSAIAVSTQIYTQFVPYEAAVSWFLLIGAAILTLFRPRLAGLFAFVGIIVDLWFALVAMNGLVKELANIDMRSAADPGLVTFIVIVFLSFLLISFIPILLTIGLCFWIGLIDRHLQHTPWWIFPKQAATRRTRFFGLGLVFAFLVAMFITSTFFVGVKRVISYEMTWEDDQTMGGLTHQHQVTLTYIEQPGFREVFDSDELFLYLKSLDERQVMMQVEYTYDLGFVNNRVIKQIGEWEYIEATWGSSEFIGCGYGTLPQCGDESPWDPPFFQ